jgi:hypothetical protein
MFHPFLPRYMAMKIEIQLQNQSIINQMIEIYFSCCKLNGYWLMNLQWSKCDGQKILITKNVVIKMFWSLKLGPLKIQPNMFLWVVFLNIPFRDGVLCLSRLQNSHMPKHFTYSFAYLYLAMGNHSSQINILLCWPFWPSTFHFLKANIYNCSFRPFEPLGLNMMGEGTHTLWELKCSRSWCIYLKKNI